MSLHILKIWASKFNNIYHHNIDNNHKNNSNNNNNNNKGNNNNNNNNKPTLMGHDTTEIILKIKVSPLVLMDGLVVSKIKAKLNFSWNWRQS